MQRVANSNLLLTSFSSFKRLAEPESGHGHRGLYQQAGALLLKQVQRHHLSTDLGEKLLALAEQARSQRQLAIVENISQALMALPLPPVYETAGRYFRALEHLRRRELDPAKALLERLVGEPSHRYTARAIQSLGVAFHARGDFESALKLYVEAGERAINKGRIDLLTAVYVQKNIGVLKSTNGDHAGALSDLERMLPLARRAGATYPQVYYDYLNSVAFELSSLGRLAEARRASEIAIASPLVMAYPEWQETFSEICDKQRQASRSVLAVPGLTDDTDRARPSVLSTHNVMQFPEAEPNGALVTTKHSVPKPARVLNFHEWKMLKGSKNAVGALTTGQQVGMTTGQKLIKLMDLISRDETDDETIDRILKAVEQIVLRRGK